MARKWEEEVSRNFALCISQGSLELLQVQVGQTQSHQEQNRQGKLVVARQASEQPF
jgi:hypothetical protein